VDELVSRAVVQFQFRLSCPCKRDDGGARVSSGGEGLGGGVKRDHIRRMDIPHSSYCYS
jgi:hypothetical protein